MPGAEPPEPTRGRRPLASKYAGVVVARLRRSRFLLL